ncbi:MAG: hypothetical protein EON60_02415 [Alphaproteobacteria bacterium]|nr:MAG: hypothetical protein EON60_02415 [Alphaproteobacteria bacterium]
MLTRRTLLTTTAAVAVVTMTGIEVANAAPGKLVGESFFCLKCIANGNVAIADVERVSISYSSLIRLQSMDIDAGEIERYLARGIYTPEKKAVFYEKNRMELLLAAKALHDAGKLDVSTDDHGDEPAAVVWTRNGVPHDSGTNMSTDDFLRFRHLMNADDYERYAPKSYIVASIIE